MKVLKWVGIVVGILVVLVIVALLIVPRFIDINKYKPQIESMVTESTGRPFSIGGDIDLTLFPWAGITLSELHLGNPKGFEEKHFVSVENFDVKVRLLPLIVKDVQVKRFVMEGPKIALVRNEAGRGNWEGLMKPEVQKEVEKPPVPEGEPSLPIRNLTVGEFAITSGEIAWIDRQKGTERRVTDIEVILDSVAPDREVGFTFSAHLDGEAIEAKGEIGPFARPIGEGKIPISIGATALNSLTTKIQGFVADLSQEPRFSMEVDIETFSPREVAEAIGMDLSKQVTDPDVLREMSMKTRIAGTAKAVALEDGVLRFDDSTLQFKVDAREFDRPVLAFHMDLDRIDVDRYLPPAVKKEEEAKPGEPAEEGEEKKPDYTVLRRLVMDGTVRIGQLQVRKATLSDVELKITAKNGIIRVAPFSMGLYSGSLAGNMTVNVQENTPRIQVEQRLQDVQAGPLLKDLGYTDRFEGLMNFISDLSVTGIEPAAIKQTLTGSGEFAVTDGAIVGFDIAQMLRNVTAAFGLAEKEKPRTEFSELKGNFTVKDGLLENPTTYLASPLIRVLGKGKLDLAKETIDYRVEPKFVATMKGQGDAKLRSGLMVPVAISGTFSNPKFRPDMSAIAESEALKAEAEKLLEGLTEGKEGESAAAEEALELLEGLTTGEEEAGGALEEFIPGLLGTKKKK